MEKPSIPDMLQYTKFGKDFFDSLEWLIVRARMYMLKPIHTCVNTHIYTWCAYSCLKDYLLLYLFTYMYVYIDISVDVYV